MYLLRLMMMEIYYLLYYCRDVLWKAVELCGMMLYPKKYIVMVNGVLFFH